MEQLFITPTGRLQDRWVKAFPNALPICDISEAPDSLRSSTGVIWLDMSALSVRHKPLQLQAALSFGWPVVVLSASPNESEAFQALKAGARGYCHLQTPPERLRDIGQVVQFGGIWMLPELINRLVALSVRVTSRKTVPSEALSKLTSRELMVAEQVASGASNREIAETLDITERTVKAHLSAAFEKLDVRDRVQLALAVSSVLSQTTVN